MFFASAVISLLLQVAVCSAPRLELPVSLKLDALQPLDLRVMVQSCFHILWSSSSPLATPELAFVRQRKADQFTRGKDFAVSATLVFTS